MTRLMPDRPPTDATPRPLWRRAGFALVNVWLVYHLIAIAGSPATIPPSSQLQRDTWLAVGPYLEAIYLNHGWHYFAPDPGASTLLAYEGVAVDGTPVAGVVPDRRVAWPRQLYHRYFMLTEAIPQTDELPPGVRDGYVAALAGGLGKDLGVAEAELTRVTHRLPSMDEVRAGFPLDDPALYERESLGRHRCAW